MPESAAIYVCTSPNHSLSSSLTEPIFALLTVRGSTITWTNSVRYEFLKRFVFGQNVDGIWGAYLVEKLCVQKCTQLTRKNVIDMHSTNNDEKCYVVETWNGTVKTQLCSYLCANDTQKSINILQPIIDKKHSTKHRASGMT